MEFLFVILLSIPVFYILGIVQLISWFFRSKRDLPERTIDYQKLLIKDLEKEVKENPDRTIKEQLEKYKQRYQYGKEKITITSNEEQTQHILFNSQTPSVSFEKSWSNWYSNNSINLLLYIGAFLIVLSASIFVGFQWGTISGGIKAGLLTLLTGIFFICGFVFYVVPKIKNAGYTFVTIGALLLPICGAAWYNFVLKDTGVEMGPIWLITSLITVSIYLSLALFFKNKFYSYIASASTLSATLSIVNTFSLQITYYILGSILSSFILLLFSFLFKTKDKEKKELLSIPFEISSQILMPITLLSGLITAIQQDMLFTMEATLSVVLAGGFYLLSAMIERKFWKIAFALVLFPVSFLLFCLWQQFAPNITLSLLDLVGLVYIALAYFFSQKQQEQEMNSSFIISFIIISCVFLYSWITQHSLQTVLFGITGIIGGLCTAHIKKHARYVLIAATFLGPSCYVLFNDVLHLSNQTDYLSLVYLSIAEGYYALTIYFKKKADESVTLGISSIIYFCIALLFAITNNQFLFVVFFVTTVTSILAIIQLKEKNFLIATIILSYFTLFQGLRISPLSIFLYPLFFTGLSYLIYFLSFLCKDKKLSQILKVGGLLGSLLTPIIWYFFSFSQENQQLYELYALVSFYGTVLLYGYATTKEQIKHFGYFTSTIAMILYLWQIRFNGVTEVLLYTFPLGVYFLILGFMQKKKSNEENAKILTFVGLLFFLVAPFLLSLGQDRIKYSSILGILSIVILGLGINLNDKYYRYAGIAGLILAIIPQTYSYILLLPRWVVVGIIGLLFLIVAIYLLLKRKE